MLRPVLSDRQRAAQIFRMPRQAYGRPPQATRPNKPGKQKVQKNRRLNALEIAEQENPEEIKISKHRLGEVDPDSDAGSSHADADERLSKRRKLTAADLSE